MLTLGRRQQEKIHCELMALQLLKTAKLRAANRTGRSQCELLLSDLVPEDFACGLDFIIVRLSKTKARIGIIDDQRFFDINRQEIIDGIEQNSNAA